MLFPVLTLRFATRLSTVTRKTYDLCSKFGMNSSKSLLLDCFAFNRGFFILGQILLGIGASPVYTIALNYLDENVKEVYSSTYHGRKVAYCLQNLCSIN